MNVTQITRSCIIEYVHNSATGQLKSLKAINRDNLTILGSKKIMARL